MGFGRENWLASPHDGRFQRFTGVGGMEMVAWTLLGAMGPPNFPCWPGVWSVQEIQQRTFERSSR